MLDARILAAEGTMGKALAADSVSSDWCVASAAARALNRSIGSRRGLACVAGPAAMEAKASTGVVESVFANALCVARSI